MIDLNYPAMKRLLIFSIVSSILFLNSCERLISNKFVSKRDKSHDAIWAVPTFGLTGCKTGL